MAPARRTTPLCPATQADSIGSPLASAKPEAWSSRQTSATSAAALSVSSPDPAPSLHF
jgi:hypothetical protein